MKSFFLLNMITLSLIFPHLIFSQEIVNQNNDEPGFEIINFEPREIIFDTPFYIPQEEILPPNFVSNFSATCKANKKSVELGKEVTWSYSVIGVTDVVWRGETLDGATESVLTTTYNKTGSKNVSIIVTPTVGVDQIIPCSPLEVIQPPLLLECSVSEKVIAPNSCVNWNLDIETSFLDPVVQWSGHSLIQSQRKQNFSTCYPEEGYYLADATVLAGDQERTIYCGAVLVTKDKDVSNTPLTQRATKGFLTPGKLLEGHCFAEKEEVTVGESVTWLAEINQEIEDGAFRWKGSDALNEKVGARQTIKYSSPLTEKPSFILTTESGESYNFPCNNSLTVTEKSENETYTRGITFWIRFILLWGVIGFWVGVLTYTIKIKFFR